jgi:phosphoglycolate phosphatase
LPLDLLNPPRLTVVFDLDGTLVDTADDVGDMINPLLVEYGRRPITRDQVVACFGLGAVRFVERALALADGPPLTEAQHQSLMARFLAAYTTTQPVRSYAFPGVADCLAQCRASGWRTAVCTNKPAVAALMVLDHLGLTQWFDGISGGDSAPARKPDPRHLQDAVARAGGSMERAVMVGDSETDAAVARNAGVPVVLIAGGYSHGALERIDADRTVDGFAALHPVLTALDPGYMCSNM